MSNKAVAITGGALLFLVLIMAASPWLTLGVFLYSCTDLKDQVPALIEEITNEKE